MRNTRRLAVATSAVMVATGLAAAPGADPGHQHGGTDGHLAPIEENVELIGRLDLFGDDEHPGRISDVAAYGDHAYLGAFREPECEDGGVYVVDISDPTAPVEVGFIPASPMTHVGEGVQVVHLATDAFEGEVLVHNNENCTQVDGALPAGRGGVSLWDVTDPEDPELLADHAGDTDLAFSGSLPHLSLPHQSHSAFAWQQGDAAYLVMVDNGEFGTTDIDILDITDPTDPELVVETGLDDFPEILEDPSPNGSNAFLHDMVVKEIDGRFELLASYWDGGYLRLDVTDLPEKPVLIADSDFGAAEPFAAEMGLPDNWTPEGNAHQAEYNHDSEFVLAADEDFGPYRIAGIIGSGPYEDDVFSATQGSDVPSVDPDNPIVGPTVFVGDACAPLLPAPSEDAIALIVRGTCTFTVKAQTAERAGYSAGIVFNDTTDAPQCDAQANMLAVADIPFMFVGRSTGLKILQQEFDDACEAATPPVGSASSDVELAAIFDGWGYVHLYDTETMEAIDHWALPEGLEEDHATGFGDLSVHEVATDPNGNLAYVSHYAGGFRVLEFSREDGIREVGAFIDEGGNNFWGVEVHVIDGVQYALASDRDSGLYIFQYTGDSSSMPSQAQRGLQNRPERRGGR